MNRASSSALLTVKLFGKDQLGNSLPAGLQLALFAHAGHVSARFANGAQRTAVFGRQGSV
jgi:hypothetical protein